MLIKIYSYNLLYSTLSSLPPCLVHTCEFGKILVVDSLIEQNFIKKILTLKITLK